MNTNVKQILNSEKDKKLVFNSKEVLMGKSSGLCTVEQGLKAEEWEFFDVLLNLPFLQERLFTHVSTRLLTKYEYWNAEGEIRLYYFVDLLVQAREIVIKSRKYDSFMPAYCSGIAVLANNEEAEIAVIPNDSGKLTIKLASDA